MATSTNTQAAPDASVKTAPDGKSGKGDKTPDSHSAIFSIPTHATTHALSAGISESSVNEAFLPSQVEGRPRPTLSPSNEHLADELLQPRRQLIRPSTSTSLSSRGPFPSPLTSRGEVSRPGKQRPESAFPRSDFHVEETPFPSLVVDESSAPPTYNNDDNDDDDDRLPQSSAARETLTADGPPNTLGFAEQPPGGGRFPRWRGWLEKRAMEKHFEWLDAGEGAGEDGDVKRKKSWGAGVDDDDALSDGDENENEENEVPDPNRGPLHLHSLGSRFISHLSSLPLCSAYLDIPPPTSRSGYRLLRRSVPEGAKRQVLLIGTADGLYVAECRKRGKSDGVSWSESLHRKGRMDGKKKEEAGLGWNDNIRCRQVWSGVGVYQMSILTSKNDDGEPRTSMYGFPLRAPSPHDAGILLALCSTTKDSAKSPSSYLGSQSVPLKEGGSTVGSAASTHLKDGSLFPMAASHFAVGGGGGPAKTVPPHGSGAVRMWSLEALRRVVAYTVDASEPRPMDLLERRSKVSGRADGKTKLTARIRKAWASLGDPASERRAHRASRQAASLGSTSDRSGKPSLNEFRSKLSAESDPAHPSPLHHQRSEFQASAASEGLDEFGQVQDSFDSSEDTGYGECFRLAQSSVVITLPGGNGASVMGQQVNLGQGDSFSSLFSDESMGVGGASNSGHGSSNMSHSSAKGVLFFSVLEAGSEMGVMGTWYMAVASPKAIYLYEAVKPTDRGETRSWAFVKEYYTPFPPKAITLTYSTPNESDDPRRLSPSPPLRRQAPSSTQQSTYHQGQVKSSPYSSVFRSHADLTLFVSFGKKAVLIRASDANVKEVEVSVAEGEVGGGVSSFEANHGKLHLQGHGGVHKRRSLSADLLGGDVLSSKEQWVGVERVMSKVIIRCKHHSPVESSRSATAPVSRFDGWADEDDDGEQPPYNGQGVTLRDVPPMLSPSLSHGAIPLLKRASAVGGASSSEGEHVLKAAVVLLTRAATSYLYPLPMPWDLLQHRPLGSFQWSDTPTAVTAWSRVIGLERDLSSGPISISSLGPGRKKPVMENVLHLHVSITALAFLHSRIETKRKRIKVQAKVPFVFNRDSELELESIGKDDQQDDLAERFIDGGDDDDDEEGGKTFSDVSHQELEYLCGMLNVAQKGQGSMKPWEAANDAGAWAFDWRGANDFRLFYVGARV